MGISMCDCLFKFLVVFFLLYVVNKRTQRIYYKLEMWANAQRDGRALPNIGGALC